MELPQIIYLNKENLLCDKDLCEFKKNLGENFNEDLYIKFVHIFIYH